MKRKGERVLGEEMTEWGPKAEAAEESMQRVVGKRMTEKGGDEGVAAAKIVAEVGEE
jgi:hypothetical protein